jgi:hypothetical protein
MDHCLLSTPVLKKKSNTQASIAWIWKKNSSFLVAQLDQASNCSWATIGKWNVASWFCTVDWDARHPECLLQALSSSMSDHCPIMMSTNVSIMHRKARFTSNPSGLESQGLEKQWRQHGSRRSNRLMTAFEGYKKRSATLAVGKSF